jgi:predicted ArsR family transcriptional regulator
MWYECVVNAADSIGRTLARLGQLSSRHGSETDSSRQAILRNVQEATEPLSIDDICAVTKLHANTIRTHLDVLRAAGSVERVRENAEGRGRPKWLYYSTQTDDPYLKLSADLADALAEASGPGMASEAAKRWRMADNVRQVQVATTDEAVAVAAGALSRLGFDVDVSPVGNAVFLGNCPYAALVHEHPIICDIHAQALEQVLAGTGQDVELESLDVFARPGVCVAHLRRKDVTPDWVVPGAPREVAVSADGQTKQKRKKKSRRTA